jgi:hypothetical protein
MPDKTKLVLNKSGLQNFLTHEIEPFADSIEKVSTKYDDQGTATIGALVDTGQIPDTEDKIYRKQKSPLGIGRMGLEDDGGTAGAGLISQIKVCGKSITDIYDQQGKLFKDFDKYLNRTITKLMDAQHDSLEKIDGKTFIDNLGTVPSDFGGSTKKPS